METQALLSLALSLSEAAFDGLPLHDSLRGLGQGLGADEVMLYRVNPRGSWSEVHSLRTTADILAEYQIEALPQNPRRPVWEGSSFAAALDFDTLVPPELLERGPVGAIMRRTGFPSRHIAGLKVRVASECEIRFSLGRNRGGRFDAGVQAAIETLAPHLAAAFRARSLLAPPETHVTTAVPGLGDIEALPMPLALADGTPRLVHVNAALRALAERGDGLGLGQARLVAKDPRADAALARAAREVPHATRAGRPPLRAISVPRRSGAVPYLVQAIALGRAQQGGQGTLFVVSDPLAGKPDAERLRVLLGLTQAEATLAAELATGATLDAAAGARGIARETARTQLKSVLAKTGCARQADLARLLARLSTPGGLT
jgi:DNA-binding CsgD family transcriptional regulator